MKKIKTILTQEERAFLKTEKKSIIRGFKKVMRQDVRNQLAGDEYKNWMTWRLIAMIEKVDQRSVCDINVLQRWLRK